MGLAIDLATAKTNKYASRESGDTVEFVERPTGGFSAVMVDGQGSGAAAKSLSLQLTARAVGLLKDGVRDGVVARAVHDTLFAFRGGKVSATLDILSADLKTNDIVSTRNAVNPLVVADGDEVASVQPEAGPVGLYHFTRPSVVRLPLKAGLMVVSYTDGIFGSGNRTRSGAFDVAGWLQTVKPVAATSLSVAQAILDEAVARDSGRPADDMAVIVLTVSEQAENPLVRTINMRIPLP
ncbi:MAG: SpoIIE family protein phosphatase [Thermomicrobiales bacterium]|jgi:serine phosphatase RsbU (regulator of sigma subunit)|nr:SpoIIE family protein phosphatase [Thermomicrobiales bacterium]